MATPGTIVNMAQYVGTDRDYPDSIVDAGGSPVDVTNWQVTFTVHEYGNPANVWFSHQTNPPGDGGITLDVPAGGSFPSIAIIHVVAADTINMQPGQYQYVVERVNLTKDDVPTSGLFTLLVK